MAISKVVPFVKPIQLYVPGIPNFGKFLAAYGGRPRDLPPGSPTPAKL